MLLFPIYKNLIKVNTYKRINCILMKTGLFTEIFINLYLTITHENYT